MQASEQMQKLSLNKQLILVITGRNVGGWRNGQKRGSLVISRAMGKQSDAVSCWGLDSAELRLPSAVWEKPNVRQMKSHQEGQRPENVWEFLQNETYTSLAWGWKS